MGKTNSEAFVCRGIKAVALPVTDETRARRFYGETLGLPVASVAGESSAYQLGATVLLLKLEWYAPPSDEPSPRITLEVDDARATEQMLRDRGVAIADGPLQGDSGFFASFLDSEGNKLWFCSYV